MAVFDEPGADTGREGDIEDFVVGVEGAFIEGGGISVVDEVDGGVLVDFFEGFFEVKTVPVFEIAVFDAGFFDFAGNGDGDGFEAFEALGVFFEVLNKYFWIMVSEEAFGE